MEGEVKRAIELGIDESKGKQNRSSVHLALAVSMRNEAR